MDRVGVVAHRQRGEAGTSLVGLLVVLVALGAMAALAASALTGEQGTGTLPDLATTLPGTDAGAVPAAGPARLTGASSVVACKIDAKTLQTAMAAVHAVDGVYPASLSDLVTRGFLSEVPQLPGVLFSPEVVGGQATGRILVNGLPPDEGCR